MYLIELPPSFAVKIKFTFKVTVFLTYEYKVTYVSEGFGFYTRLYRSWTVLFSSILLKKILKPGTVGLLW